MMSYRNRLIVIRELWRNLFQMKAFVVRVKWSDNYYQLLIFVYVCSCNYNNYWNASNASKRWNFIEHMKARIMLGIGNEYQIRNVWNHRWCQCHLLHAIRLHITHCNVDHDNEIPLSTAHRTIGRANVK